MFNPAYITSWFDGYDFVVCCDRLKTINLAYIDPQHIMVFYPDSNLHKYPEKSGSEEPLYIIEKRLMISIDSTGK
jgi:hypothetical protein